MPRFREAGRGGLARRGGALLAAAVLTLGAALLAVAPGCRQGREATQVSLADRREVTYPPASDEGGSLRFAVGAMLTPQEGYAYYTHILKRIERDLGLPVRLVDRTTYAAINEALERGEIDAAFICSGPYVEGHSRFGLEILAVPVVRGTSTYRSLVIVNESSPLRTFEELRGGSFAFTDPDSNTGHLVPRHLLAERGESPGTFFAQTIFTGSHDKSILAVAERHVDGAAVDSLIWEHARREHQDAASRTRVVWSSVPFGIPPVVVRHGLDPGLKQRLREVFLGLHREAGGEEILAGIGVERFAEGRDEDYDSIRAMEAALAGAAGEEREP